LNCLSFIDLGIFKPILALKQNVCVTCLEYEIYSLRIKVNKPKIKQKGVTELGPLICFDYHNRKGR
jgi:hypothetical protein